MSVMNYGEKDRIAKLITEDVGEVRVFLSGARASKSSPQGRAVMPLRILQVELIRPKISSGFHRIRSARVLKSYEGLARDYDLYESYTRMVGAVSALVGKDDGYLFHLVELSLESLSEGYESSVVQVGAIVLALGHSGQMFDLSQDAYGEQLVETNSYGIEFDSGGLVVKKSGPIAGQGIKLMRLILRAGSGRLHLESLPEGLDGILSELHSYVEYSTGRQQGG